MQRQVLRGPWRSGSPAECRQGDKKGRLTFGRCPQLQRGGYVHGHSPFKGQWQKWQGFPETRWGELPGRNCRLGKKWSLKRSLSPAPGGHEHCNSGRQQRHRVWEGAGGVPRRPRCPLTAAGSPGHPYKAKQWKAGVRRVSEVKAELPAKMTREEGSEGLSPPGLCL